MILTVPDSLVHRMCAHSRNNGDNQSACGKCPAIVSTPYGQSKQLCRSLAEENIAIALTGDFQAAHDGRIHFVADDLPAEPIPSFSGKYRWLSNFWLTPVCKDGMCFPSVENAYQADKAPMADQSNFILMSPGKAKEIGQQITPDSDWPARKLVTMKSLLKQKFRQGSYLSEKLMGTGSAEIIEGNTWGDVFWGVCEGVGENHLGIMLMEIRKDLFSKQ